MSNKSQKASAPAPTMADLIDNLMQIEMLTATGEGLDPATTIDVHLLAGIGRAVDDDAAWYARAPATAWQPIETAPRDGTPVLTYSADAAADPRQGPVGNPGTPILVMAYIVGEWELVDEIGDWHIPQYDPTHWMPLPAPPVDSSAAQATAVDDSTGADPVGKEG